jgi:hypothetical protein
MDASICFSNDFSRLTRRSNNNSSNSAAKFGPAIQSSSSTNVSNADLPPVEDNVELPLILLSGQEESTVAVMEESAKVHQIDENSDVAYQTFLDNCLESDSRSEQDVLEEHSDSDLEKLMEDSPSIEQIVEAMNEEPRNNGRFIEATPPDDEFQMHHQDLRFWQGRGPPRDGRGNGWRSASQSGRGSGPGQGRGRGRRNRDSLANSPVPVSMDVLPSSGPSPNDATDEGRRKRTRESNDDPAIMQVVGGEEPKGDDSFTLPSSPDPFLPQPCDPTTPCVPQFIPVLEALRQYSTLVDGARMDGPDYTPCEWTADLLLQDIPWNHLPLICALGRPLDFIPTSHVLKVRRAFTHCLRTVLASPLDDLLWKRFCLLPTVLFIDIGKHRRADLDCKINLILANTWPFQVGDFPGRMTKPKPSFRAPRAVDSTQ